MAGLTSPRKLKFLSDESLIRFLIQTSRDRFDPKVSKKPTQQEAQWIITEVMIRMAINAINCPHCGAHVRNANFCSNCGQSLTEGEGVMDKKKSKELMS